MTTIVERPRQRKRVIRELPEERDTGYEPHAKPDVRTTFQAPLSSGEFLITPKTLEQAVDLAIPLATQLEDTEASLKDVASDAYSQALEENPQELPQRIVKGVKQGPARPARLRFIQRRLNLTDTKVGDLLGITPGQVRRLDLRAKRKAEIEKDRFDSRLDGLTAVANMLGKEFKGYAGVMVDRRASLTTPNARISDVSVGMAMRAGFTNIGVAIAVDSVRVNQESFGQQRRAS